MNNTQDIERWLRDNISQERIEGMVNRGIAERRIIIPRPASQERVFAGGTNFCPNSDLSWSEMAATTAGITPATAGATNLECHRWYRQIKGANISSQRLRDTEADAWIPVWDRVNGTAKVGSVSGGDDYDTAVKLVQNWIAPSQRWYVRVALATSDETPLPSGTKFYAGFWVKQSGGSEGWADGSNFLLDSYIPVKGSRSVEYKVIAKSDSGVETESQVLSITDAPDVPSTENHVRISYSGASGLIEFILYRKEAGQVFEIARQRNSNQLWAFDNGQQGIPVGTAFPSASTSVFRSYAEVLVDAVSIDVGKSFNNLTIQIPSSFDASTLASEGVFLRMGVVGNTTLNRQVIVDTIWLSTTFNVWSPSPHDNSYLSPPSTSITTGVPTGGSTPTGEPPPIGGGNSCVWVEHDLLLANGKGVRLKEVTTGLSIENGVKSDSKIDEFNVVKSVVDAKTDQYWLVVFTNGLAILCSSTHRFVRSLDDNSGVMSDYLNDGDRVLGVRVVTDDDGSYCGTLVDKFKVDYKLMVNSNEINIRFVEVEEGSVNKFYAVGTAELGLYVFAHNRKYDEWL